MQKILPPAQRGMFSIPFFNRKREENETQRLYSKPEELSFHLHLCARASWLQICVLGNFKTLSLLSWAGWQTVLQEKLVANNKLLMPLKHTDAASPMCSGLLIEKKCYWSCILTTRIYYKVSSNKERHLTIYLMLDSFLNRCHLWRHNYWSLYSFNLSPNRKQTQVIKRGWMTCLEQWFLLCLMVKRLPKWQDYTERKSSQVKTASKFIGSQVQCRDNSEYHHYGNFEHTHDLKYCWVKTICRK